MNTTTNHLKNVKRGMILFTLFISLSLISCERGEETDPEETGISTPSDADGYLIADRTSENGSSVTFNSARAAFSNTPGVTGSFVDVGTVKCNSTTLTKTSNIYQAIGLVNFSAGTLTWEVTGGSGFGAFSRNGLTFPTKPVISSSASVAKSGYTITNNAISGADKLLYTIGSQATPSKLKLKWASSASVTSMTFSSSDLSGFTIGEDVGILVTAYKVSTETLGGKKIYIQISSQDVKEGTIN